MRLRKHDEIITEIRAAHLDTLQNQLPDAVERVKQLGEQVRHLRGRVKELELGSA
jgi:hypothetical protein